MGANRGRAGGPKVSRTGQVTIERWPRYLALEVEGEAGIYACPARGPGAWTAKQLWRWAESIGAELVLMESVPEVGKANLESYA